MFSAVMRSGALIAAAAVGAWVAPAPAPVVPAIAAAFRLPLGLTHSNGIGLTFDDGPHPSGTPAVLDMLAREAVKATFYLVGEQVERWPELAARTAAEGHEIGIHGYHHTLLLRRSPRALGHDLDRAAAIIREATGATPTSYRPPYGVFSMAALMLVRQRGWAPQLWSRWGRDWGRHERPADIARRATAGLRAGDVILLHDADHYSAPGSWRQTLAALPPILSACAAVGVPAVSVTQRT